MYLTLASDGWLVWFLYIFLSPDKQYSFRPFDTSAQCTHWSSLIANYWTLSTLNAFHVRYLVTNQIQKEKIKAQWTVQDLHWIQLGCFYMFDKLVFSDIATMVYGSLAYFVFPRSVFSIRGSFLNLLHVYAFAKIPYPLT